MKNGFAALIVVATGVAASVAAVSAAPAVAAGCSGQALSRPFARFLDPSLYTLAPGGTFENGNSWSGGAAVSGNEPWQVTSESDAAALSLPAGASSTTPFMCTGIDHPTLRFFAKGSFFALLRIDVIYRTPLGNTVTQPAGLVVGSGAWLPTIPFLYVGNDLASLQLDGSQPSVAYRFTSVAGSFRIDDVYVDPWASKCC